VTDERTCGKGLAEHSALPRLMGELTAATATVLEQHTRALDLDDSIARQERDAYAALVSEFRDVSRRLTAVAKRMAGYRDLPMGRHDMRTMMDRDNVAAFQRYVRVEEELLGLLRSRLDVDHGMLAAMESRRA
jgi:hypothetical protein